MTDGPRAKPVPPGVRSARLPRMMAISWGPIIVGVVVFLGLALALGVVLHIGQGRPHS